ncbi:MAG: hypothetical protein HYZ77_07630 [Serratia liquefaciens]|nr:hypothetical protein [Serratia liquefaciens]
MVIDKYYRMRAKFKAMGVKANKESMFVIAERTVGDKRSSLTVATQGVERDNVFASRFNFRLQARGTGHSINGEKAPVQARGSIEEASVHSPDAGSASPAGGFYIRGNRSNNVYPTAPIDDNGPLYLEDEITQEVRAEQWGEAMFLP